MNTTIKKSFIKAKVIRRPVPYLTADRQIGCKLYVKTTVVYFVEDGTKVTQAHRCIVDVHQEIVHEVLHNLKIGRNILIVGEVMLQTQTIKSELIIAAL